MAIGRGKGSIRQPRRTRVMVLVAAAATSMAATVVLPTASAATDCSDDGLGPLVPSLHSVDDERRWRDRGDHHVTTDRGHEKEVRAWAAWHAGCVRGFVRVEVDGAHGDSQAQYDVMVDGIQRGAGLLKQAAHVGWVTVWEGYVDGVLTVEMRDDRTVPWWGTELAATELRVVPFDSSLNVHASVMPLPASDYPHLGQCSSTDDYLMVRGNCTSYVAYVLNAAGIPFHNTAFDGAALDGLNGEPLPRRCNQHGECHRKWGDARYWADTAAKIGIEVDYDPAPGSVLQIDNHVAYVRKVYSHGTLALADMNGDQECGLRKLFYARPGEWPNTESARFIHFERLAPHSHEITTEPVGWEEPLRWMKALLDFIREALEMRASSL